MDETLAQEQLKRRKRVKRLKKAILIVIPVSILIPLILCIVLAVLLYHSNVKLQAQQSQYKQAIDKIAELEGKLAEFEAENIWSSSPVVESERNAEADEAEYSQSDEDTVQVMEQDKNALHKVYFTFDDGPSTHTNEILDILKKYQIKATFFVTGKTGEDNLAAYKRIVEEGHTLGMHSYSHVYRSIYASTDDFVADLDKIQELLYETTGVWCRLYRFPGGSSNRVSKVPMIDLIDYLDAQDITYFDWNVASGDAQSRLLSADEIYNNCMVKIPNLETSVILFHDAAEKKTTVDALPRLIEAIQNMEDTAILPIDDDTQPIQHTIKK